MSRGSEIAAPLPADTRLARASRLPLGQFLVKDWVATILVVTGLVVVMQIVSVGAPAYIMPPPRESAAEIVRIVRENLHDVGVTLLRLLYGMLCAAVVGSLIGILAATSRRLQPYLKALVVIDTGVPALSWMLFAIFWFKNPEIRVFFILAVILIPFYALSVQDGVRALPADLLHMVETFRPSKLQIFRLLILPHLLPYLLTTTRTTIGFATRMVVFAELIGSNVGMGAQMSLAQSNFEMQGVIAWTVVLIVLSLSIQGGLTLIEKYLLSWRPALSIGARR